jgi:ectoine hydroxylase-related dioxygenase (phytanoyl-CoA dioxygenase family)
VAGQRQFTGGKESGTRHPGDLINRSQVFHGICTQPKVLPGIHHILRRPFRLSQFSGRDPLPGYGQQGLHADWMPRSANEPAWVVTAIWLLDDFTKDNGATRIVPGTHRLSGQVPKAMADPSAHHPEEQVITGKAGSVLLFNGHLWHSGTRNDSRGSRRALQSVFWAREAFPPYAEPLCDRADGLTPAVRYILGL